MSLAMVGLFVALGPASAEAQQTGTWAIMTGSGGTPAGLAVDNKGDVFVANSNGTIVKGVQASPGTFSWTSMPGPASAASGIAVDNSGDLFVVVPPANPLGSGTGSGSGSGSDSTVYEGIPESGGSYLWSAIGGAIPGYAWDIIVNTAGDLFVTDGPLGGSVVVEAQPTGAPGTYTAWAPVPSSPGSAAIVNPAGVAINGSSDLFLADYSKNQIVEGIPSGSSYTWSIVSSGASFDFPAGVAVDAQGDLFVANIGTGASTGTLTNALDEGTPNGAGGYTWSNITPPAGFSPVYAVGVDGSGNVYIADYSGTVEEWRAPVISSLPQPAAGPITLGSLQTEVVGNFGLNTANAIQNGTFSGFVEERAAIEAGSSFNGEGIDSSYLSAILSGSGVGQQTHVSAVQQGQFAALYQKLGIIPTWTDNTVSIPHGVATLVKASASPLAIENYLVQLDGFSWAAAEAQAAAGFPVQSGT